MLNKYARFGRPDTFEIAIRWSEDTAPAARRPAGHGWSMGHLELTVAGVNLSCSRLDSDQQSYVGWYLGPVFDWLATNWVDLLHEESSPWSKRDPAPAAVACRRALDFWIGKKDEDGRNTYRQAQQWYRRHGLRSAAAGGLFPDLFIRRVADDIELSWSGEPPLFAPRGLAFESGAGVSRLAVADVAVPLWEALQWLKSTPPGLDASFLGNWKVLCRTIDAIDHLEPRDFEGAAVAPELLTRISGSFARIGKEELLDEHVYPGRPFVEAFSPAVAMFGGISPKLDDRDVDALRDVLVSVEGGKEGEQLAALVLARQYLSIGGVPHEDGYQFAEDFLSDIEVSFGDYMPQGFVDVRVICDNLDIRIKETALDTDSIRGVALAGVGFQPIIVVNLTSVFNRSNDGQRFTIAHELCHILFDRTRARRVAHTSGPWAAVGIERRANAFAAYLLMPREVIQQWAHPLDEETSLRNLATRLQVNETALVEHLYNLDFIDEIQRENLRTTFRGATSR